MLEVESTNTNKFEHHAVIESRFNYNRSVLEKKMPSKKCFNRMIFGSHVSCFLDYHLLFNSKCRKIRVIRSFSFFLFWERSSKRLCFLDCFGGKVIFERRIYLLIVCKMTKPDSLMGSNLVTHILR